MTTVQKKKILKRIVDIEADIETLKKVRQDLLSSGYASATMSSGSGSRSYTRQDASKVSEAIAELVKELKQLRAILGNSSTELQMTQIYTVYF